MSLEALPPWSKSQLRRLGDALLDRCAPPEGCPDYGAVMLWHNDLAGEVAAILTNTQWSNKPTGQFAVTARSKTVDTLIQKLARSSSKLDRVQDIAGVRIDADMSLTQQTLLAHEIADYFGRERATVKDLRDAPHSGYRAVHIWLIVPAGRAEVQIRTLHQSEWANTYEGIADLVGRGIRYNEPSDNERTQRIVQAMHELSKRIARDEKNADQIANVVDNLVQAVFDQPGGSSAPDPGLIDQALEALSSLGDRAVDFQARLKQTSEHLRSLRRILDGEEVEG
ncbi:GTP pyrophosphokinase yjbM [Mycobacteroides abscessus subsp. abscessus]|nr:GTP pyrophosphokinase yjbM [Mycobacteroides abscessus subsp. abscessus]